MIQSNAAAEFYFTLASFYDFFCSLLALKRTIEHGENKTFFNVIGSFHLEITSPGLHPSALRTSF